eukprot:Rhum_TRINITY_DN14942_c12_g1::Rhum_TRINITY_DN14942_c12_g1_i1::g.126812::m.126812
MSGSPSFSSRSSRACWIASTRLFRRNSSSDDSCSYTNSAHASAAPRPLASETSLEFFAASFRLRVLPSSRCRLPSSSATRSTRRFFSLSSPDSISSLRRSSPFAAFALLMRPFSASDSFLACAVARPLSRSTLPRASPALLCSSSSASDVSARAFVAASTRSSSSAFSPASAATSPANRSRSLFTTFSVVSRFASRASASAHRSSASARAAAATVAASAAAASASFARASAASVRLSASSRASASAPTISCCARMSSAACSDAACCAPDAPSARSSLAAACSRSARPARRSFAPAACASASAASAASARRRCSSAR